MGRPASREPDGRPVPDATPEERPSRAGREHLPALATTAALLVVAIVALPTAIQAGDAGEFSTVMLGGGVPHPSGYPWMRVLGLFARGVQSLSSLPPASAAALPCALAGIAAWWVMARLAARWGRPRAGAWVALWLGLAPVVALHVFDAEVWGLHLLACAGFTYFALRPRGSHPALLGLLIGLAVSHHLTAVLLVPLAVGAAWPRENPKDLAAAAKAGALGLGGSLLGLLPYFTLMVGDGDAWRWGDTQSLSGLLHHVSRADYGVLSLSLHDEPVSVFALWGRSLSTLGQSLVPGLPAGVGWLAALVVMGGMLALARRPPSVSPAAWWGYLATIALCGLVFPATQNIDPASPFGAWILERFDLLTLCLLCPGMALAAARLGELLGGPRASNLRRGALALLALALPTAQVAGQLERGHARDEGDVERLAICALESAQPNAIVFGTDDHRTFPILYAQEILGTRPDVLYVDASLLAHPWYRARLRQLRPGLPDVDKPVRLMKAIWDDAQTAETPVYLANVFSRPSASLPRVPEGLLWRVPPQASPEGRAFVGDQIRTRHLAALERCPSPTRSPALGAGHPWSSDLRAQAREPSERLIVAERARQAPDVVEEVQAELTRLGL